MKSIRELWTRLSVMLPTAAVICLIAAGAWAQGQAAAPAPVADQLASALQDYTSGEFDKGIAEARNVLTRSDLSKQDSIAAFEALSVLTYAKGQDYLDKSYAYLETMAKIGPCVLNLPRNLWPQALRDRWYQITQAANALVCTGHDQPGVKTIAIMQFDNYSVGKYQTELGLIAKGLADMFAMDFAKLSDIKVVERDKINFVLNEIELQQSGKVDQATAVKVGKILGAQYMVFGSITQLDDKLTRMVVRAVSVETSEIVASVDKEGKPEYFNLEKQLVGDLAKELNLKVSDKAKKLIEEGGTSSNDATRYYSMGLDYMDKYDYKNAYENFKKAYETDPNFVEAKRKMDIYRPLAG
jgi:TolB-like protein